jgi:hypothetical protein
MAEGSTPEKIADTIIFEITQVPRKKWNILKQYTKNIS